MFIYVWFALSYKIGGMVFVCFCRRGYFNLFKTLCLHNDCGGGHRSSSSMIWNKSGEFPFYPTFTKLRWWGRNDSQRSRNQSLGILTRPKLPRFANNISTFQIMREIKRQRYEGRTCRALTQKSELSSIICLIFQINQLITTASNFCFLKINLSKESDSKWFVI